MKTSTAAVTTTRSLIAAAVEVYRGPALARTKELAEKFAAESFKKLEGADWNVDAVAPSPRGSMGRYEYAGAKRAREAIMALVGYDHDRCDRAYRVDHRNPRTYVKRDDKKVETYVKMEVAKADMAFSGYVSKLEAKVGAGVTAAAVDSGSVWSYSILTVTMADGSVQRWKTQCIINHSVLGTLFNQWPTRRVK